MNWRTLLAKIGLCDPPVPDLPAMVREASDRSGTVNRRAFLQIAGAAVASTVLIDPESLIWSSGEKAILLPEAPVLLATPQEMAALASGRGLVPAEWLTREVLKHLENNLKFSANINRAYDPEWAEGGRKVGHSVNVRIPQRFVVTEANRMAVQPITDNAKAVVLTDQLNVSFDLRGGEDQLTREQLSDQFAKPCAQALAKEMRRREIDVTAKLDTPLVVLGGAVEQAHTVARDGLAVRGMEGYYFDPYTGRTHHTLRFDLLGGSVKRTLARDEKLERLKAQRKHRRKLIA